MANYVLEILDGDHAGEVLSVTDRVLRIGRKAGNDIVLPDEKTSGVHCEIAPEGDRFVLRDLGSTNGTFLDGKRVTELVLTPGDVVTVGRMRVKFRNAEAAGAPDAGEFAVRRLDASRVSRRGGAVGMVAVLALVAGAGGGFWWWQQQEQQDEGGARARSRQPLAVTGNKLAEGLASCEGDEGWQLRAAGAGFHSTASAYTGRGGFEATRASGDGAVAVEDFAIMELVEPMAVFAGRSLTIAAHCSTRGGARIGVRARLSSQNELVPFRFVSGTSLQAHDDGWQRLEAAVAVPVGCDRLNVEIVALLPSADAVALVDDIAVVEGGGSAAVELHHDESGQTAIGFGSALAVRSTDTDNPATLLSIVPGEVPAPFAGLHAAGLAALSDLGAALTCTTTGKGLQLNASGVSALTLVLPADAAGSVLVAAEDGRFQSTAAAASFSAQQVLLGSFATRAIVQTGAVLPMTGELGAGLYRLTVATGELELRIGFRGERQQAGDLLRGAELLVAEKLPGKALDALAELMAVAPMDSEVLGKAQALRAEVLTGQADRLRRLQQDLDEAGFFSTRGGFERVVAGVQELFELYGEANIEDVKVARQLEQSAQARLDALDGARGRTQRSRLTALADAFSDEGQASLQKLVTDYIEQRLPPPSPDSGGEGNGDDNQGGGQGGR